MTIVEARYHLPPDVRAELLKRPVQWGFGPLSEAVYYRTYSRVADDRQERWGDTVARVVEGVMSIRKDWYQNVMGKRWRDGDAHVIATRLAHAIHDMKMLPPGRGLWAMGTDYVYERGSHALNNCGAVDVTDNLARSARWLMDSLMCGVGVGFTTNNARLRRFRMPNHDTTKVYVVPDTKEGWAESVKRLIQSYERGGAAIAFDYSKIRPKGAPIKGFGGVSSGYGPLEELHERLRLSLERMTTNSITQTRLIADVMNAIGACVVAGNVRRSAELAVGAPGDESFLNLKNYEMNPDRAEIGWMSNNSVALSDDDDFMALPDIAERVADNGEPGILNLRNVQKYGRLGEKQHDDAVAVNPCGEIPLESTELCNLVEVFPTRCNGSFPEVLELATYYASTVALLRSHDPETNEVVARNRRIGVSVSGVADWIDSTSSAKVFNALNRGYDVVRETNRKLARSAGVNESIRVTTVKPSGTVSLLAGVSSGMHHPLAPHVLRRVRIAADSPVGAILKAYGVPHEPDKYSKNTDVFEFPLAYGGGKTRSVKDVSLWEQAAIVRMLQRGWADNAVSNTLTFQPDEARYVERVLSMSAPEIKSMSMLPDREKVYEQMPLERIDAQQYRARTGALKRINWSYLTGSDGDASSEAYCQGDACEIPMEEG
jgi:ribonucleoside-diphosphate reductase alpha chain